MQINLDNIGKRFGREWIFNNISYSFTQEKSYAILGANGSGKSTLLQIIAGSTLPTTGKVSFGLVHTPTEPDFSKVTIAAPYLELIEEMTGDEFLKFHFSFKPLHNSIKSYKEVLQIIELEAHAKKQIRLYSSGMKQRLKLAQAILTNCPILLLDEPCSNLDKQGEDLYYQLIKKYTTNKLIIVCSNSINEYSFCEEQLLMANYKQ